MAYRDDGDLDFLSRCSSDDLEIIANILMKDSDGALRLTEEISLNEKYKAYQPNHKMYWDVLAAELQCYGANSFITMFRGGKGVLYREILADVCDKMKVNYNSKASIEAIEMNLLMKIMTDSMEKMTPEELQQVAKDLNLKGTSFTKEAVIVALQAGVKFSGFAAYQVALIVANAVARALLGRGLTFAANAGLTRAIGVFAGPIGWAITALWTAFDVSGPAYRVTIPCVIQIAFLRAKMNYGQL